MRDGMNYRLALPFIRRRNAVKDRAVDEAIKVVFGGPVEEEFFKGVAKDFMLVEREASDFSGGTVHVEYRGAVVSGPYPLPFVDMFMREE